MLDSQICNFISKGILQHFGNMLLPVKFRANIPHGIHMLCFFFRGNWKLVSSPATALILVLSKTQWLAGGNISGYDQKPTQLLKCLVSDCSDCWVAGGGVGLWKAWWWVVRLVEGLPGCFHSWNGHSLPWLSFLQASSAFEGLFQRKCSWRRHTPEGPETRRQSSPWGTCQWLWRRGFWATSPEGVCWWLSSSARSWSLQKKQKGERLQLCSSIPHVSLLYFLKQLEIVGDSRSNY